MYRSYRDLVVYAIKMSTSYVYILRLSDNSYYVGSCRDIRQRIDQHNHGYVASTRKKLPFHVVYVREYGTYAMARKEEMRIKGWKKRNSIENLYNNDVNNLVKIGPIV